MAAAPTAAAATPAPTAAAQLEIQPLTPARLPDLAALFAQGGDPKWCWYQSQVGGREP